MMKREAEKKTKATIFFLLILCVLAVGNRCKSKPYSK